MSYYLMDHPNPILGQFGWERAKLGRPGQHLSGVVGVHTAENATDFEGADPGAEEVAGFISRRDSYGSYHTIADADSIVPLVHPRFAAWADTTNNAHALSVSGAMQAARWRDLTPARAAAVTRNMARAIANIVKIAVAEGYLAAPPPARRISATEAINGTRAGFYGHGETNPGTRYDPGQNFDWNLFLSTYAAEIGSNTTTQESELSAEDADRIINHINALFYGGATWKGEKRYALYDVEAETQKLVGQVSAKVWATPVRRAGGDGKVVEVPALQELADTKSKVYGIEPVIARIDANTSPEAVADLIPDEIAQKVIDKLSERLAQK